MARLDQLAPAKEVAQVGAVIGREFAHRLIGDVLKPMALPQLDAALSDLVRSGLVFRRGTRPMRLTPLSTRWCATRPTAACSGASASCGMARSSVPRASAPRRGGDPAGIGGVSPSGRRQRGGSPALLASGRRCGMARSAVREAASHYQAAIALLATVHGVEACADVELALQLRLGDAAIQGEGFTRSSQRELCKSARTRCRTPSA